MARPKLGETETERMQLKITTAEVEAIDDWRFANRVPSRSEAVRRLCRIGLAVNEWVAEADQKSEEAMQGFLNAIKDLGTFADDQREPIHRMWNALTDVQLLVGQVSSVAEEMRSQGDPAEALRRAEERRQLYLDEKDFETRRRLGLLRTGEDT